MKAWHLIVGGLLLMVVPMLPATIEIPVPSWSIVAPVSQVDRVIGVYDHNGEPPSSGMRAAFNVINRRGIKADWYELGGTDGSGVVSEEYKLAAKAAEKYDMPCTVALSGGKVIRVVSGNTEAAALEAVK